MDWLRSSTVSSSACCQRPWRSMHGRDWDLQLPYILFAYRAAVQDSTKVSLFCLLYGRQPLLPMDAAFSQPRSVYLVYFEDHTLPESSCQTYLKHGSWPMTELRKPKPSNRLSMTRRASLRIWLLETRLWFTTRV